jgi:hypothetical protein
LSWSISNGVLVELLYMLVESTSTVLFDLISDWDF